MFLPMAVVELRQRRSTNSAPNALDGLNGPACMEAQA